MDENALKDTTNFSYISVYFMRSLLTMFLAFLTLSLWGQKRTLFDKVNWPKYWRGDTAHFVPLTNGLTLKAPASGTTRIFHTEPLAWPTTLSGNISLNFAPSANNQIKIYFINKPELTSDTKGYLLQMGENGPDDRWEIYEVRGMENIKLFRGPPVAGASSVIAQRMTLHIDSISWWWTAPLDDSIYELTDLPGDLFTMISTEFFLGLECAYTETRKDKFTFTDFCVFSSDLDTAPPQVISVAAISDRQVVFRVNEPLDSSFQKLTNYWLVPTMITPNKVELQGANYIYLTFAQPLPPNQELFLEISNLKDYYHNTLPITKYSFIFEQYDQPEYGDILIHEIMVDPTPSQGLPEVEYIELLNNTGKTFSLDGYTLMNGDRSFHFSKRLLFPHSYLLLGDKQAILALKNDGDVYGVENWIAINNSSGTLSLLDSHRKIIHEVAYDQGWYGDPKKASGGHSLEMVDVNDRCAGEHNWRGSMAKLGGTPGKPNSWPQQVLMPIHITDFDFPQSNALRFSLNRIIDSGSLTPENLFIVPPLSIKNLVTRESNPSWTIVFDQEPIDEVTYRLSILPPLVDCSGSLWADTVTLFFGKPKQPKPGDIIFNELLFNPTSVHGDYIEIYNRTGSYLNLNRVNFKKNLADQGISLAVDKIVPFGYLCFSEEGRALAANYPVSNSKNLVRQDIPALPDDEGIIYLVDEASGSLLDYQFYHHSWHNKLIDNVEGIALERISTADTAHHAKNWTSASAVVRFGTPGAKNSQVSEDQADFDGFLQINNTIFSPNGDGYEDNLELTMHPNQPGYTVQVWLYNEYGTLIQTLIPQTALGLDYNHFVWDGTKMNGQVASMGRYIIFARFVHPSGQVHQIKKSIVVAGLNK